MEGRLLRVTTVAVLSFLCVALWLPVAQARFSPPFGEDEALDAWAQGIAPVTCPIPGVDLGLDRPFAEPRSADHTVLYGATNRYGNLHTGLDFPAPIGAAVLAGGAGRVIVAGDDSRLAYGPRLNYYGKLVIIRLDAPPDSLPVYVLYGHLNQVTATPGQRVSAGEYIGTVGMTGAAVGPHLHLEVRCGSVALLATRNPGLWLRPPEGQGVIAGRFLDAENHPVEDDRLLVYRVDGDPQLWRVVRTYPDQSIVNSDDSWDENFVLTDVPAGEYFLVVGRGSGVVRTLVTVTAGQITFVEVRLPVVLQAWTD